MRRSRPCVRTAPTTATRCEPNWRRRPHPSRRSSRRGRARRLQYPYDKERYRQRNRVERLVGRLKQFRAVATRYDKLDGMFGGLVVLCLAGIALR